MGRGDPQLYRCLVAVSAGRGRCAGGTVIHLSPSGRAEIREKLARHDVEEKTAEVTRAPSGKRSECATHAAALIRYGAFQKSLSVQAALLECPRRAKEIAVLMLLFGFRSGGRMRLTLHRCWTASLGQQSSMTIIEEHHESLLSSVMESHEAGDDAPQERAVDRLWKLAADERALRERLASQPDDILDRLLYTLPVLCFGQENVEIIDDGTSAIIGIARDLQLDLRRYWKPDEVFFVEYRKALLEQIALESGASVGIAKVHRMKKAELVRMLTSFFDRTASLDPHAYEPYERGRSWLPEIMALPAQAAESVEAAE